MSRRILSISNDPLLLTTRQLILERAGYVVFSCRAEEALARCETEDFGLVILGHAVSSNDKRAVLNAATKQTLPVLQLMLDGEPPLEGAAATATPLDLSEFLNVVNSFIRQSAKSGPLDPYKPGSLDRCSE